MLSLHVGASQGDPVSGSRRLLPRGLAHPRYPADGQHGAAAGDSFAVHASARERAELAGGVETGEGRRATGRPGARRCDDPVVQHGPPGVPGTAEGWLTGGADRGCSRPAGRPRRARVPGKSSGQGRAAASLGKDWWRRCASGRVRSGGLGDEPRRGPEPPPSTRTSCGSRLGAPTVARSSCTPLLSRRMSSFHAASPAQKRRWGPLMWRCWPTRHDAGG